MTTPRRADGAGNGPPAGRGAARASGEAGRLPRVAFATLGCKVNRADTLRVEEGLPRGVEVVPFSEVADLYVVNTCTVTGTADRDSRQLIHRAHRRNPAAHILVTGCLAELRPEEVAHREGVLEVVPNAGKEVLAARIATLLALDARGTAQGDAAARPEGAAATARALRPVYRPREVTRPPLKIQDGCAGHCTYCTVAAARGTPTSLPLAAVQEALVAYGAQGCPEVVLAGIDLGSYGRDLTPPSSLADLLGWARAARPVGRLRLSSIEIHRLDDELLATLASAGEVVCRHLHLPLQSGADAVLARMERPYDVATYRARFRAARAALPEVAISADVIAGFPGERDADHRATLALLEDLAPAYLHVFPYSARPGTPAAGFRDPVDHATARERAAELRALSDRLWRTFREAQVGRVTQTVVHFNRRGGRLSTFTDQGMAVEVDGPDAWMGRRVPLRLDGLTDSGMAGRVLLE